MGPTGERGEGERKRERKEKQKWGPIIMGNLQMYNKAVGVCKTGCI